MLGADQLPYVLAGVVLMTLQPLLVRLSQNEEGRFDYNPVSSTLLTEAFKIGISAALLRVMAPSNAAAMKEARLDPKEAIQYAIPAAIYFVNNNLVFLILEHVNATTFQLLSQLKTVFTGLLFRVFLGRRLTVLQYLAIWQLTCGTATSHIPRCLAGSAGAETSSLLGLALSVFSCMLSACGGIYSEKLLKDKAKDSIHWQNIQLYTWGVIFNLVGAILHDSRVLDTGSMFGGYNFWAWSVVLNNALNGLAISAILKYADNIARVYAHAAAMMVTMVLSIFLFGESPTPQLMIAVAVVGSSAVQYNLKPEHMVVEAAISKVPGKSPYAKVPQGEAEADEELATMIGKEGG